MQRLLFRGLLLIAGMVLLCAADGKANKPRTWNQFVAEFIEGYFRHRPDIAVSAGRHDFDGRLPDWSPQGIAFFTHFLKEQRAAAEKYQALNRAQTFEQSYLLAQIDADLFWIETAEAPFLNPTYYTSFQGLDPNVYVTREYAPLAQRLAALNRYLRNVPVAVEQIRSNLRSPLPRTFLQVGRTGFGALATFFRDDVPKIFSPVTDTNLQAEFSAASQAAIAALQGLDSWFEAEMAKATDQFALGPDKFRQMLFSTERVDVSLDDLERIGQMDLQRNLIALTNACDRLAPGRSISGCINHVQSRKPPQGPVQAARDQLEDLKYFLLEKDIVSIPSREKALVEESLPYMRWNSAYINIPGPYEKGLPSIYYIAPPDPSWSPQEQRDYISSEAELLFTSVHEVWPGHFLHFLHANRSPSRFGQVFVGYGFAEGWAHYTEELMWEAGLGDGDPATEIGMLLNALLRNVRFLSAIGLHTGRMTVAQSEQMFREVAFQDAANARQQAARGTFDPAYLNYTMAKLMIRKLREDWCAPRGGRAAWKQFHDEFLSYGGPPVPLVRKAMLNDSRGLF